MIKLEQLMEYVYKGPVAPVELEYLRKGILSVSEGSGEETTWPEFVTGLGKAKQYANILSR